MIKRLLSYFLPIKVYEVPSNTSTNLEVTWNNGQLVLDSKHTNYSFGSLEKVLKKGMLHIGFPVIKNMESILLLGVAGGSAIKIIRNEIKCIGKITGVDIDPKIIQIAYDYFNLGSYTNVNILIKDAQEFINENNAKYELIIIDIFEDDCMPNFLFETNFIANIIRAMNKNSYILFNFMLLNDYDKKLQTFISNFNTKEFSITTLINVEEFNKLIIVQKTTN